MSRWRRHYAPLFNLNCNIAAFTKTVLLCLFCLTYSVNAQNFSENFDSGGVGWTVSNGTWQIGTPTVGPNPPYISPNNCAGTVLDGNYPSSVTSTLTSPSFRVPANNPRLRFWHWFITEDGDDLCTVWVKPETGDWVQLKWEGTSGNLSGNSGGWTRGGYDLFAFANQMVQIGFRFQSDLGTSYAGWYVDDIVVEEGPYVFNVSEGFELGLGDWVTENGLWQIGDPSVGPGGAYSGTQCAGTVLNGNYPDYANASLVSPPLVVPANNPRLRFWHWFNTEEGDDTCSVWVKLGSVWTKLSYDMSGYSGGWTRASYDLAAYSGQEIRLAFAFNADLGTSSTGWYVDEVMIETGRHQFRNPEGFEDGLGDWAPNNGIWQQGDPAIGPGAGYASSNCVGTVLDGNYPNYANSTLLSPPFLVPTDNPRLRFRHWFLTEVGDDLCSVWIKQGITWTKLSNNMSGNSGGWTQTELSLAPFAGDTVQVGFHFESDLGTSTAGWYVDNVEIVPHLKVIVGSTVARTNTPASLAVRTESVGPVTNLSFIVEAPVGHGASPSLNFGNRFVSHSVTPLADDDGKSRWLVALTATAANALIGAESLGSLDFVPTSSRSSFVSVAISSVNVPGSPLWESLTEPGRSVFIANEPLLESGLDASGGRILKAWGRPGSTILIKYSPEAAGPGANWQFGFVMAIPPEMYSTSVVPGVMATPPIMFLQAEEQ